LKSVSIIGTERSGTSLTIGLLRAAGYYVEDDFRKPDRFNQKGYGESRRLIEINDKVLGMFGGSRDAFPVLSLGWQEDSRLDVLREEAASLIEEMNSHDRWAWKDPVLTITFPFWKPLLPKNHYVLICFRNPLGSSQSLNRMVKLDTEQSERRWFISNISAIANTYGIKRLFIPYEHYFDGTDRQINRISKFLGDSSIIATKEIISPDLVHFRPTTQEAMNSTLHLQTKLLYYFLINCFDQDNILDQLSVAIIRSQFVQEDSIDIMSKDLQLEYYRRIVEHPYVRFGRYIHQWLRRIHLL
jgi:hypothetical protein